MDFMKNKTLVYILLSGLFISFMFGCALAAGNFFVSNMHNSHHSECCDDNYLSPFISSSHNITLAFVQNNFVDFFVVLGFYFIFSLLLLNVLYDSKIKNYYSIKDKYGGTRLFYHFVDLFSVGILHPKLF